MVKSKAEVTKERTIKEYKDLVDEVKEAATMTRTRHWRNRVWPRLRDKNARALAEFDDLEKSGAALKQAQRDRHTYVQMCEEMTQPIKDLRYWLESAPLFKEAMKEGGAWDEMTGIITIVKLDEMPEPNGQADNEDEANGE